MSMPHSQFGTAPLRATIHVGNLMTRRVVIGEPTTTVHRLAELLLDNEISGVPIMDNGVLVGIVSEGDLIARDEIGTGDMALGEGLRSNLGPGALPEAEKARGACARDVMSSPVTTIEEDASLVEAVRTMLVHHVKRLPVMDGKRVTGMLCRSDIVRALASRPAGSGAPTEADDDIIRYRVIDTLLGIAGTSPWQTTVEVAGGVVQLGGAIEDEAARDPSRRAIERLPHVLKVVDGRAELNPYI